MYDISCLEEYEALLNGDYIPWEELSGANILITGGTGLVGSTLIRALLLAEEKKSLGLKVYVLVRDVKKAEAILPSAEALVLIEGGVDPVPAMDVSLDYIVHAASPTASKYFVENPVETVKTAVCGTMNILELAREKKVKSLVYLSSMEVYGENQTDDVLVENVCLSVNPLSVRSCYPQSKLLCENLCVDYTHEYGLPCKVVRLAQTFGPGVPRNDNRVFAQFARAAINGTDIVLETPGATKQCYLYTLDAAAAILTVLLKGEGGQAYNAANPDTYCSIREMAVLVAEKVAAGGISVKVNTTEGLAGKYPPTHKWNLSVDKLSGLGWTPSCDLEGMYRKLIASLTD